MTEFTQYDTIQRFIFEQADIRGEIVHLGKSLQTILQQHHYPPQVEKFLAETLVAAVLLTATIKFKGELTIQLHSVASPITLLVAKCDDEFHIRGLAQFDPKSLPDDIMQAVGQGKLVVTIQQFDRVKPYQSIIPIADQSVASCLESYFARSEQLATKIWIAVGQQQAAGMLLQLMPEKKHQQREEFWQHAVKLGETIRNEELLHLSNETILYRLYHEEDIRIFDAHNISFRCTCSAEKMENALRTLTYQEAMDSIGDNRYMEVTCEYCNRQYLFDRVDVEKIFRQ